MLKFPRMVDHCTATSTSHNHESPRGPQPFRPWLPPGALVVVEELVAVQWSTIRGNLSTGTCPENGMCLAFGAKENSGQGPGTMDEGEPVSKALTTRGQLG